jgi:hypothetical protein
MPDSRAALAVRTFARTASHIPTYPVRAEKPAPRRNAIDRPTRMKVSPCTASSATGNAKNSATASTTMKTPTVRNWRFRYARAPTWIARAISLIFSVPSGAART